MGAPAFDQLAFRVRNDDGSITAATYMGSGNNENQTIDWDTPFRVRFVLDEYNDKTALITPNLYINYNGGGWEDIATCPEVDWAVSAYVSDGTVITVEELGTTPSNGAFEDGEYDQNGTMALWTLVAKGGYTEIEVCITIDSAAATDAHTFQLRLYNGTAALDLYTNEPTITVNATAADVNVYPAAVAAGADSVDPTTQLGSISYAPTLIAAGADSTNPATQLGDIDFTPAVVAAGADSIDPSVQQDSMNVTPAILAAGADSIDPTVQMGSLNITPSVAAAGADSIDPTVEIGAPDINVYPAAVTAGADAVDPSTQLGSISITPIAGDVVLVLNPIGPRIGTSFPGQYKINRKSLQASDLLGWWSGQISESGGDVLLSDLANVPGFSLTDGPTHAITLATEWANTDQGPAVFLDNDNQGNNDSIRNLGLADGDLSADFPFKSGVSTEQFTASCWFKMRAHDASQRHALIVKQGNPWQASSGETRGFSFGIAANFNRLEFELYKDSTTGTSIQDATTDLTIGEWYHLACSYKFVTDGTSEMRVYVDGVEVASRTDAVGPGFAGCNASFNVGYYAWGSGYAANADGWFKDVRVYNRTLDAAEIYQIFAPEARGDLYRPVLRQYWTAPGLGTGAASSGTTAVDPTVRSGSINITPSASTSSADSVAPTTQLGSVSVTPVDGAPGIVLNPIRPRIITPPSGQFKINRKSQQANGLAAWWPFGNNQFLEKVNGIELTKSGSPSFVVTDQGVALDLTAATPDYLYDNNQTLFTGFPFSVSCWVWLKQLPIDVGDECVFVSVGDIDSWENWWNFRADDSTDRFQFNFNDGITQPTIAITDFVARRWYNVVGVAASTTDRRILVNGGSKGTNTNAIDFNLPLMHSLTMGAMQIGSTVADYADVYIRDVRYYNRALSDQDAQNLYNPRTRQELYSPVFKQYWVVGGTEVGVAAARTESIDPTVEILDAGINVSPSAATAGTDSIDPTVQLVGSADVYPDAVSAGADSVDPNVQLGSLSITPVDDGAAIVLNPVRPRLIVPPTGQFSINRRSPQARGIASWWPGAGNFGIRTLRDFSGGVTNAPITGASWQTGETGPNLYFDGNDYVNTGVQSIGNTGLFCDSGEQFSVASWFKVPYNNAGYIVAKAGGTAGNRTFGFYFQGASNRGETPCIYLRGTYTFTNANLDDNQWHQFIFTWDGTTARWYNDGKYGGSLDVGTASEEAENIVLGARSGGTGFFLTGNIGDTRIHDVCLSSDEVFSLYAPQTRYDLYKPVFKQYWVVGGTGVGVASAGTASINPDVQQDSLNITPAAATAGADSVDPTTQLGSVSITPTAAVAGADSIDPTVDISTADVNVYPDASTASADSVDPSVQQDSLNITPSVLSAGADSVIDEARQGSLGLSPTLADAAAVGIGPSVEQDSMDVTPTAADASAVSVDPTVQLGSPPIYPDPAVAGADSINPTVRQGSIDITPVVADAGADSIDPSITLSSVSVTPDVAAAVADSIDPTVQITGGGENIYPVAVEAGADSVIGEIRQSSMSVSPILVEASAVGVDPSVEHGDIDLTPAVAAAGADSFHEETKQSSISFTPAVVSASAESVDPTTHQGDLDLSPAVLTAAASGIDPTITLSSVSVSPAAGSAGASTVNPLISISGGNFVAVSWARIRIPASGINVTPRPASARTDTSGNVRVTIQANSAFIAVTAPTVTLVQVHILTASGSVVNVTSDTVLLAQEHKLLVHRAVIVVTSTTVELGFPTLYPLIKDGAVNSEISIGLEVNSAITGVGNVTSRVIVDGEINSGISADLEITERLEVPDGN